MALVLAAALRFLTPVAALPLAAPVATEAAPERPALTVLPTGTPGTPPRGTEETVTTVASWTWPTSTPRPTAPAPAPNELSHYTSTGPTAIRLWTGGDIEVQPAHRAVDQSDAFRWMVPERAAGWHSDTDDCGSGYTVIGGHVGLSGVSGVFSRLVGIKPGDQVVCTDSAGVQHTYMPVDYLRTDGLAPLTEWKPEWQPALALYTCVPELTGEIFVIRFVKVESLGVTQ